MVIFTDLDGCLLEEETYDHRPARPALARLAAEGIPLVLCTSKTVEEVRRLAAQIGHEGPWIVENGGAIALTAGPPSDRGRGGRSATTITLGAPAGMMAEALARLARDVGIGVEGLSSMTDERVAALTGLDLGAAALAKARQYSEPFVTDATPDQVTALERAANAVGLRVTKGGRFFHLTGDTDKGAAVRWLLEQYGPTMGRPPSVALGDAPNDLPMLRAVDRPIVVPRPDGRPHPVFVSALPEAECAPRPGPAGWNAAVLAVLDGGRLPLVRLARAEART